VPHPQLLTAEEKLADAKKLLNLPRIVVICGSTRFMTEMAEADLQETEAGKIVVKPGLDMKAPHRLSSDPLHAETLKARLADLHRAKIRLADEVLVVGDYIGDSTRAEIVYARSLSKPVRFTHPDLDPTPDHPLPPRRPVRQPGTRIATYNSALEFDATQTPDRAIRSACLDKLST
jgi:hypothetical protein